MLTPLRFLQPAVSEDDCEQRWTLVQKILKERPCPVRWQAAKFQEMGLPLGYEGRFETLMRALGKRRRSEPTASARQRQRH